jgi:hypothetical protein
MSDYEVGYAKPPQNKQFQKGKSGNSKGRPKKSKNYKTALLEALDEEVVIKEGNKKMIITKGQALVKATLNKALSGDIRALKWVSEKAMEIQLDDTGDRPLSENDETIVKDFLASMSGGSSNAE